MVVTGQGVIINCVCWDLVLLIMEDIWIEFDWIGWIGLIEVEWKKELAGLVWVGENRVWM